MKVHVLLGHPDCESFNGLIFVTYCDELTKTCYEIKVQRIGKMKFDLIYGKSPRLSMNLNAT